ncbi:MAG: hypothetical protein AAB460_01840 [Patescibacteria group bacterium]
MQKLSFFVRIARSRLATFVATAVVFVAAVSPFIPGVGNPDANPADVFSWTARCAAMGFVGLCVICVESRKKGVLPLTNG